MSDLREWSDGLEQRLAEDEALVTAAKRNVAGALQAGKAIHPAQLAGIARLEVTVENLRAYREARMLALAPDSV
jgi:hypothetical protein